MSAFLPKLLVAAALAVLLLVGDLRSSALLLEEGENGSWWIPGCRSGSRRKTFPSQKKDCAEGESLDTHGKKTMPFLSLRSASPPPPSPRKGLTKTVGGAPPPSS